LGISKSPRSSLHGHDPAVAGEKGKTKATPAAASERGEVITDLMMALLYTAMEMWHSMMPWQESINSRIQTHRQTDSCCPAAPLLVISA
jgi:hypothetical protein